MIYDNPWLLAVLASQAWPTLAKPAPPKHPQKKNHPTGPLARMHSMSIAPGEVRLFWLNTCRVSSVYGWWFESRFKIAFRQLGLTSFWKELGKSINEALSGLCWFADWLDMAIWRPTRTAKGCVTLQKASSRAFFHLSPPHTRSPPRNAGEAPLPLQFLPQKVPFSTSDATENAY